ncbi:hypothetical protein NB693_25680 [Pantoea ananatis]|uniref:hypothetical protein n=1 Tax=Pantoea ananas TaxID=553 RepID=UPI00221E6210|nr:hypothetical protein [Pantoea ananatis]
MTRYSGPLLTRPLAAALLSARDAGATTWSGSLDLERSQGRSVPGPGAAGHARAARHR